MKLYLASQSPRRSEILTQYRIPFQVIPNLLEVEPPYPGKIPFDEWVLQLARLKAKASTAHYQGWVIGVDTLVVFNHQVYGKPPTQAEARRWILSYSNQAQTVYTGIYIIDTVLQKTYQACEKNEVWFKSLTPQEVDVYLTQNTVTDKAGGYGIQDSPALIQKYTGSLESIMGFPIETFKKILKCGALPRGGSPKG